MGFAIQKLLHLYLIQVLKLKKAFTEVAHKNILSLGNRKPLAKKIVKNDKIVPE